MNNIFKIVIIVLMAVIGVSLFYILDSNNQNLDVGLVAPKEVMAGVPFDFKVEFSNQMSSVLKDVLLIVTIPDGAAFVGSNAEKLVDSKDIGDLGQGSLVSENYKLVFLKNSGDAQKIKVLVSYTLGSSKYEKESEQSIKILNSGMSVEIKAPEKIFSGEEFEVAVNYKNTSEADFYGMELSFEYPASFTFISSDSKPDSGNNIWELGDLRSGSEGKFALKGSIIGPDNSSLVFKPKLKIHLDDKDYFITLNEVNVVISPSPLSLGIILNDRSDYVAGPGENLKYIISYINNSDVPLRSGVVRVQLQGELFDFSSLDTKAMFRSSDNTLIWNSGNSSELDYIAPRSAGFVYFNINTLGNYPVRRLGDKDFVLSVKAEIESPTVPEALNANKTYNVLKMETKVAGRLSLLSRAYFRDASAGILNAGSMPPKVGQATQFTVHWSLQSFATDFSDIEVRASLREGVKFTGVAKSDFSNAPTWDEKTNEMVWILNKLPANKGFVDTPAEAIFQIEAAPSISQVANYMPLIGEAVVKATDAFTNKQLELRVDQITTALPSDVTVGQQGGVVQP